MTVQRWLYPRCWRYGQVLPIALTYWRRERWSCACTETPEERRRRIRRQQCRARLRRLARAA